MHLAHIAFTKIYFSTNTQYYATNPAEMWLHEPPMIGTVHSLVNVHSDIVYFTDHLSIHCHLTSLGVVFINGFMHKWSLSKKPRFWIHLLWPMLLLITTTKKRRVFVEIETVKEKWSINPHLPERNWSFSFPANRVRWTEANLTKYKKMSKGAKYEYWALFWFIFNGLSGLDASQNKHIFWNRN